MAIVAYWYGLYGGFVFDDEANLVHGSGFKFIDDDTSTILQAIWLNNSGPLGRPVSMLSFAIEIAWLGFEPWHMKLVNLLIHWLNSILVYHLTIKLYPRLVPSKTVQPHAIASLVAILWLLHPINHTAVLYIIQRMASLSGTFVLLACLTYAATRISMIESNSLRKTPIIKLFIIVPIFIFLAAFSKESGLLIPVFLFIIEIAAYRFTVANPTDKRILQLFFLAFLFLPIAIAIGYLFTHPDWLSQAYGTRDFSLLERILTQSRALMWYVNMIALPDVTQLGIFHDDFEISKTLFSPTTTIYSYFAIATLLITAVVAINKIPWLSLGIFWFFAGHLMESTIIPLEMVYEHRNYIASIGVLIAIVIAIETIFTRMGVKSKAKTIVAIFTITIIAFTTHTLSRQWSDDVGLYIVTANNHPRSLRANIEAGTLFSKLAKGSEGVKRTTLLNKADSYFEKAASINPTSPNALFGQLFMHFEHNLEGEELIIEELSQRLARGTVDATTLNGLGVLTECIVDGFCKIDRNKYFELIRISYENPSSKEQAHKHLLLLMAKYYANKLHDYNLAIQLIRRCIKLAPHDVELQLMMIKYLANDGRVDEALQAANSLSKHKNAWKIQDTIRKWKEKLESIQSTRIESP